MIRVADDLRAQETERGVLGDRGSGRGAGGLSAELRAGMLDCKPFGEVENRDVLLATSNVCPLLPRRRGGCCLVRQTIRTQRQQRSTRAIPRS